jgi:hypothetical protein
VSSKPEGDDGGLLRKPDTTAVASDDAPAANAEVRNPDARNPDVRNPDARNPDARNPDARNPDARNPDARNPDARNPDVVAAADDDEPVPRLPRTWGFKVSTQALVRIAMTGALLAMILVARRPCADSVSGFVTDFDKTGSAVDQMPKPGRVDMPPAGDVGSAGDYETLRPDMTEAEIKAAIERAKARAKGSAGSANPHDIGSASSGSASSGSASSGSASSGSASSGS